MPEIPDRYFPAPGGAAPEIEAASQVNCRRGGCTSSCRSQADRTACLSKNSFATAACNDALHPFRILPAIVAVLYASGSAEFQLFPQRLGIENNCAARGVNVQISAWLNPSFCD